MIDQTFFVIKLSQGQESVDHRMILSKSFDKSWSDDLDKIMSRIRENTWIAPSSWLIGKELSFFEILPSFRLLSNSIC